MAIAIPLIGGVREAANNTKCRSNLKQLHAAIFAFATGNKERLPDLINGNLQSLIDGGHIESESKLGLCPGDPDKSKLLPISSYTGGPDLDGTKTLSSEGINSNTIVLADADKTYHKAGRNAIRLDGSFTQTTEEHLTVEMLDLNGKTLAEQIMLIYDWYQDCAYISVYSNTNNLRCKYNREDGYYEGVGRLDIDLGSRNQYLNVVYEDNTFLRLAYDADNQVYIIPPK